METNRSQKGTQKGEVHRFGDGKLARREDYFAVEEPLEIALRHAE